MLPETEIRYSFIYNVFLNQEFTREDLVTLKEKCRKFEALYNKYSKILLKSMEKHGFKWKRAYIPIYIVKNARISFSDPLTLRFEDNQKMMLVVLSHELLHNNIFRNRKFKSRKELHMFMEPLLEKILSELPINLNKELSLFNQRIHKSYGIK